MKDMEITDEESNLLTQGNTIVRRNMIADKNYTGYCGADPKKCSWPRTRWDNKLGQTVCPECGSVSQFPADFIALYRKVHQIQAP